jgi:hypothetical protein
MAVLAVFAAGCGPSRTLVGSQNTSTTSATGAPTNRQKARVEAKRLLGLVVTPPGSVRLDSASSLLPGPIIGTPLTISLIDETAFWRVPMSMTATLAWIEMHPPGGLEQFGSGSSSAHGVTARRGYAYEAPSSPAWTGAEVDIGVASTGENTSVVRADGEDMWIDPIPVPDSQPGARMRVSLASGCPSTDRGVVGVTNPPPPLEMSLVPAGNPTAGLVCEYYGPNDHPFELKQKRTLDATAARNFSMKIRQVPLGHLDGQIIDCPNYNGSATVVALGYPDGKSTDLWMTTSGCTSVSNGYISASGSVAV